MIVIAGAGLAGLAAARFLQREYVLYERELQPGGLCRTVAQDGFQFDYAGHWFHARLPWVRDLLSHAMGRDWAWHRRDARIWSHGVLTPYPFQTNLGGLPEDVALECIMGLIESRYTRWRGKPQNFLDFILRTMGAGVAKHFMIPYNQKLWNIHPRHMTTEWMGRFVPEPDVEAALRSILNPKALAAAGYNAGFHYPRRGGIERVPQALARGVGPIECGTQVCRVETLKRRVTLSDGRVVPFDAFISTMPLRDLVRITADAPGWVREAGRRLSWSAMYVLSLGVTDLRLPIDWCYVPETPPAFFRAGCYSNACPAMAPRGAASLYVEYSYRKRLPPRAPDVAAGNVLRSLRSIGLLGPKAKVVTAVKLPIPCAYVTYDRHRTAAVTALRRYFAQHAVHSIGRYGAWEYSSMEDAMNQGKVTAEMLNNQ